MRTADSGVGKTFNNVTSIEEAGSRTILMAVLLPPELQPNNDFVMPPQTYSPPGSRSGTAFSESEQPFISEIDDPSHNNYFQKNSSVNPMRRLTRSKAYKGTVTYPLPSSLPTDRPPLPAPEPRTFAILETWPGMNPWDLGTAYRNFTAVFGHSLHQWLLPVRHSPCCEHDSSVSFYPLGPQFEEMLDEVGLVQKDMFPQTSYEKRSRRSGSQRRRRRRLEEGWQHGERPDGWISEKEARRVRNVVRARTREHDNVIQ